MRLLPLRLRLTGVGLRAGDGVDRLERGEMVGLERLLLLGWTEIREEELRPEEERMEGEGREDREGWTTVGRPRLTVELRLLMDRDGEVREGVIRWFERDGITRGEYLDELGRVTEDGRLTSFR